MSIEAERVKKSIGRDYDHEILSKQALSMMSKSTRLEDVS